MKASLIFTHMRNRWIGAGFDFGETGMPDIMATVLRSSNRQPGAALWSENFPLIILTSTQESKLKTYWRETVNANTSRGMKLTCCRHPPGSPPNQPRGGGGGGGGEQNEKTNAERDRAVEPEREGGEQTCA